MVLAHQHPLATHDLDVIPKGMEIGDLDVLVKKVAEDLNIQGDWLNPYYSTFAHTLSSDYEKRLIEVFKRENLIVRALGKEEMLLMKCFAGRQKDISHAKHLIRQKTDVRAVERRIEELKKKGIPGCEKAMDFLDDVLE